MKIIGLSQAEQDEIFRMLAAILWTGNIQFREDEDGYAAVVDQSVVDFLAYLLDCDAGHVIQAITIRILTVDAIRFVFCFCFSLSLLTYTF
ncbi:hypothetical protein PX690_21480 [Bacillus velezensis]|uniref:hypothetical protein n=1 Tax=Bacillus velezensis TaxID=492670 RepID=UPI0023E1BD7E|nr:hypothetical protein [Bacillus velezensis]WES02042.1 hypothetical protein PX690_21480 [Bacillus velezensis]